MRENNCKTEDNNKYEYVEYICLLNDSETNKKIVKYIILLFSIVLFGYLGKLTV